MSGAEDPRKLISSLLISSSKGVTLFRLMQDYREFTGQDVPYRKMGYSSIEDYIRSIPETCRLSGYGREALVIPVVNEQTKHINEMILKQRAPKSNPRARNRNIKRSRGIYDPSISYNKTNYIPKKEPNYDDVELPDVMPDSHLRVLPPPIDYYLETKTSRNTTVNRPQTLSEKPSTSHESESESHQTNENSNNNGLNSLHRDMAAALSEESDYDEYLNELDFDDEDDDDDFYYKSDGESVDLSTPSRNLHESASSKTPMLMIQPEEMTRSNHVSVVNDGIKEKLRLLISEHPDGIWCSKLLKMYRDRFKQDLEPMNFGFSSVIQLCDDIPDVFHCIRPNRMDWKIYDSRKPVPDVHSMRDLSKYLQSLAIINDRTENTEPALPNNLVTLNPSYKYPESVLHPDETIERLQLPDDDNIDHYFEIIVAEVYDPSKFWIQFKGSDTYEALEALMNNMQIFYMHHAGALQLNEFSVRIGLFVAALFLNEYHRAVVIKVFSDETLKVFYIDYGTVGEVSLRKTCLLHRDFTKLPQQAIRSRLDNIVPIEQNTMWTREASQFMLNMVMEKTLVGLIRHIDRDQQILHVILTDTSQEIDIHINDELVNAGYAALGNEAPICSTSSAIVPNVHLYPSFEELENYIYPSVGDVNRLLKIGHTFESIFHGYFRHSNCTHNSPENIHSFNDNSKCIETTTEQNNQPEYSENEIEYEELEEFEEIVEQVQENPETTSEQSVIVESPQPLETIIAAAPRTIVKHSAPPGFENIQPNIQNYTESTIQAIPAVPIMPLQPMNPLIDLPQYMNQAALLNLAIINPLLYSQVMLQREMYLHQQREALLNQQRNALLQQQFEAFHRNVTSRNNTPPQESSPSPNMYDNFIESKQNDNEQENMRNVIKLNFNQFNLHVIKLENNYYVITQEIITTLLKSKLTLKTWLQQKNLNPHTFPNKLINLSNYPNVYNELVKFNIPGFYKATNLGCNTRVTLLHDIVDIIYKHGDHNIIPELKNSIKNATESEYLWEVLHSSD